MPIELFSRRTKLTTKPSVYEYENLRREFRVQVWHILDAAFGRYWEPGGFQGGSPAYSHWKEFSSILHEERGVFGLCKQSYSSPKKECVTFLVEESDASGALDFIELAFRFIDKLFRDVPDYKRCEEEMTDPDDAISMLNYRLDQHHLGYQFVDGQLIRRDSQFIQAEVVIPAVLLLHESGFEGPHEEFLMAHKAYLKHEPKEAIRESLAALESTLKAICTKRKWRYDPSKDTAKALIELVVKNELIPSYLLNHFTGLRATLEGGAPTIRNKDAGHGQGPEPIEVPMYLAAYTIHLTASAILLLIEAHKNKK